MATVNRIQQLTDTIREETRNGDDLLTRANGADRSGNYRKAEDLRMQSPLCYAQAEHAQIQLNVELEAA